MDEILEFLPPNNNLLPSCKVKDVFVFEICSSFLLPCKYFYTLFHGCKLFLNLWAGSLHKIL